MKTTLKTLALAVALASASLAQAGTLDKAKETGVITLGYRISPPFSYEVEGKPVGYSVDLCMNVVEAVKKEIKRPDLTVKFVKVTLQNRLTTVQSGEIDIECSSTTSTTERRKLVEFTVPTFVGGVRFLVKKNSGIAPVTSADGTKALSHKSNDIDSAVVGLKGKRLVTTKGASSEKFIQEVNNDLSLGATITIAKDHNEAFNLLETGKADAFLMDDIILASQAASSKAPGNYTIVGDYLSIEPLSIMFRKDDPAFKAVVDTAIKKLFSSEELKTLYKKWFESPIPPKGINLQFPMPYLLKDSFRAPTDKLPW